MLLRRFAAAALIAIAAVADAHACSMRSWEPNDMVSNEPDASANGRYAAILRWYDGVEDFKTETAAKAFHWDGESDVQIPERTTFPISLYELATRRRIGAMSIGTNEVGQVLVSDTGQYVIVVRSLQYGCYGRAEAKNAFVTIFRSDGSRIASLKVADVLSDWDVWNAPDSKAELRYETAEREVLVLTMAGTERRIEIASGKLLDEKRDIFAKPRLVLTAIGDMPRRHEYGAPLNDRGALHVDSRELFEHVTSIPEVEFPLFAWKARIRGIVWVQVIVSEHGDVAAMRTTSMPFGMTEAAISIARGLRFRPFSVDGHRVPVTGELVVHFDDVHTTE